MATSSLLVRKMKNMKKKMNMKNKILVPLEQGGYTADGSTPQAAVAVVIRKQSKKFMTWL